MHISLEEICSSSGMFEWAQSLGRDLLGRRTVLRIAFAEVCRILDLKEDAENFVPAKSAFGLSTLLTEQIVASLSNKRPSRAVYSML